ALLLLSRPPVVAGPTVETRLLTWFSGLPALVGLLGKNLAYHALLKRVINSPGWLDQLTIKQQVNLLSILVICVQPAIVEELYFRYLALGTLRRFMGVHGAVLISSVMFGLAHLGVPLSVPMLTVIGVGLGYLRVYSGSLVLPMLVHLAHNTVVLIIEAR
ncbi:MAG: lysostaphin resistance A-like protein, partial [Gemmataceae bacterium]